MKVLIFGLGSIAKKHIDALKKVDPSAQIYALRSSCNATKLEGIHNIFDINDAPKDIEFSMVTNPTSEHLKSLKTLLPLGKPIFIEKPPVQNNAQKVELIELLKRYKCKTYVAFNLRFHPSLLWLKANLSNYRILEVNVYCGSYLPDWRNTDYKQSYSSSLKNGGGVHLDLIHELDYVLWLFGHPKNIYSYRSKISDLEITSPDFALYHLNYENKNVTIKLNYYRKFPKREIELVIEDDIITVDLINNVVKNAQSETLFESSSSILETYYYQLEFFKKGLTSNEDYQNNLGNALKVLDLALS